MDRNQVIGFGLLIALFVGYYAFFAPDPAPPSEPETAAPADTVSTPLTATPEVIPSTPPAALDSASQAAFALQQAGRFGIFAAAAEGQAEDVVLENDQVKVTLSTQGGMPVQAELKTYNGYWSSQPIQLWDRENSALGIRFNINGKGSYRTDDFYFKPEALHSMAAEGTPASVTMKLVTADPSRFLSITYTLDAEGYDVQTTVNAVGLQQDVLWAPDQFTLEWDALTYHNEKGIDNERQYSSPFYRMQEDDRSYLSERSESDEETLEDPLNWVAFKQHFFSAMVISDGFAEGAVLATNIPAEGDTLHNKRYFAEIPLQVQAGQAVTVPMQFYFGPNEFTQLEALGAEDAIRIIDYGWTIFGWVNRHLIRPVFAFLSQHISSAGLVIILLTILIKLLLSPVTWKNYLNSAKMKAIRPELDELNKKFEGKPAVEKQQATMELYRKTGVSPLSGCIPALLQMPILYAMFRFFPASIELRGRGFLWAEDLSAYDAIFSWTGDLGFISSIYGNHVSGFTLLMAASTFLYTRMNSSQMAAPQQPGMPNMKVIMNIFPFIMLIFFNKFASGLSFYYFISNLMSISQMWVIKRYIVDDQKVRAKIEANKKAPKKTKSSFQQRLEEMQKVQQERARQQQRGKR